MHIQYKIGLKQKSVPSISSSSYRPEIDFKISKTYQSLEVTSNEPYIGSGYIKTDQIISKYKYLLFPSFNILSFLYFLVSFSFWLFP